MAANQYNTTRPSSTLRITDSLKPDFYFLKVWQRRTFKKQFLGWIEFSILSGRYWVKEAEKVKQAEKVFSDVQNNFGWVL